MTVDMSCPLCGGEMVSRKNNQTGQRFWGCKAFPRCRGTRNTDGKATYKGEPNPDPDADTGLPSERARRNDRRRW